MRGRRCRWPLERYEPLGGVHGEDICRIAGIERVVSEFDDSTAQRRIRCWLQDGFERRADTRSRCTRERRHRSSDALALSYRTAVARPDLEHEVVFLASQEAKAKLLPALSPGNVERAMSAPVTAVLAHDTRFFRRAAQLFPHRPAIFDGFAADAALAGTTAFRNGCLQAAHLMIAARALGLDCGPMSDFDEAAVNRLFFPDGDVQVNFLCNLGYGDASKIFPRLPRLSFLDACSIR
ncbi:malonic semialdehyde reductase [Variovorax sp. GB1P17]|uniref:malonic semialdehyde reductase n=1 Tax=Variovorax sp. GB1P17 TaxID=3443740 RepID=UPI003F45932A